MSSSKTPNRASNSTNARNNRIVVSLTNSRPPTSLSQTTDAIKPPSKPSSSKSDSICLICAQLVPGQEREKIFAFGKCDHSVCYVCSSRLRVLCEQNECPICREKLEHVIFSSNIKPYESFNVKNFIYDEKHKIYFVTKQIKTVFDKLLNFECLECLKYDSLSKRAKRAHKGASADKSQNNPRTNNNNDNQIDPRNARRNDSTKGRRVVSPSFNSSGVIRDDVDVSPGVDIDEDTQGIMQLSDINKKVFDDIFGFKNHLNYVHRLRLCDLCLSHSKLFPFEFSYYDRKALIKHMNEGEKNTSHRGHPICKLCHRTFFNQDELLSHMARDHFHCHFCERSSSNLRIYFHDYASLREHFKASHLLCERGTCREEQFTSAFENDIDYQMHLVQVHGNPSASIRQREARQARTFTLETAPHRARAISPSRSLRQTLPENAVITTLPMAMANSSMRNRPNVNQASDIFGSQRMPSRAEFPALGNQSDVPTSSSSQGCTNYNGVLVLNNTTINESFIAGPSSARIASFVRTAGGGRSGRLTEMDFPPLPDQPKTKAKNKKLIDKNKTPLQPQVSANRHPQTIEQLFSSSLTLSAKKANKKSDNQKIVKQKPIKFQIS